MKSTGHRRKRRRALLEAMQERQVTAGGKKHLLPTPFFVLATQNPIEQEGTYPLPEAQLDRFMFNILVDYPSEEEEIEIMKLTTADYEAKIDKVLNSEEIIALQDIVRRVPIGDHQINYAISFARMTRVTRDDAPEFIKKWISWGAGHGLDNTSSWAPKPGPSCTAAIMSLPKISGP